MFQKIAKHRANDASNDVHRPPLGLSFLLKVKKTVFFLMAPFNELFGKMLRAPFTHLKNLSLARLFTACLLKIRLFLPALSICTSPPQGSC